MEREGRGGREEGREFRKGGEREWEEGGKEGGREREAIEEIKRRRRAKET